MQNALISYTIHENSKLLIHPLKIAYASTKHRKKMKAETSRLLPRNPTENLEI